MTDKNMIGESVKKITIYKSITCSLDDSVSSIALKLKNNKERRIFVIDNQSMLVGIITTTDLVYKVLGSEKINGSLKAKDIMVGDVKSIDIAGDLEGALSIMNELKTFTCPVTDKKKLVGVLSYHDLVNYVFSSLRK